MYPPTFSNRPIRDGFEKLFLVLINRGHSADLNFLCGSGAGVGLRSVSAEISDDSDIQRGKLRKGLREFVDHYRGDDDHGIRVADEEHSGSPYAEGRLNAIRGLLRAVDTKHDPGILEDVIINLDDDADYEGVEHGTASEMVAAILKHCKHRAKEGGSLVEEIKSVLLVFQSHWAESCRRFARENKTAAQIIVEEEKRIAMEYQVLSWEVKYRIRSCMKMLQGLPESEVVDLMLALPDYQDSIPGKDPAVDLDKYLVGRAARMGDLTAEVLRIIQTFEEHGLNT